MSVGLIALLDDVAVIARAAAASLDDVVGQATKVGVKSAGIVIDDAAVTPRYVIGLSPARELPVIRRIATGSIRNKLLFLMPVALALSVAAPWAITPLLMLGGAFLCFEGAEKVHEAFAPPHEPEGAAETTPEPMDAATFENRTVKGAVRTDFILSAEIMAVSLAALPPMTFWKQAAALAVVAIALTVIVYGAVALIVKADDVGLALAKSDREGLAGRATRALGRGLVKGMPWFLRLLSVVGTVAMLWVGGGILVHGLAVLGHHAPEHAVEWVGGAVAGLLPGDGAARWIGSALANGVVGLGVGFALEPLVAKALAPGWARLAALWR